MPRPLRVQYPGAVYHVMNRGNAAQAIFRSQKNYQTFLKLLGESVEQWDIRIHAFSLMPNHYHLLVETPLGNLSRAMRHIDGVYTQRYNRQWKRDGHLFRGRYKAILVEEDAYLVELLRYIHLNPVLGRLVDRPEKHIWTSHQHYLGVSQASWLTTEHLLSFFGKRRNRARRKLHEFVLRGIPVRLRKLLSGSKWPTVFSSEHFREWVEWNFVRDLKDGEIQYTTTERYHISELKLKNLLCEILEMEWGHICNAKGQEAKLNRRMAIRCFHKHLKWSYGRLSKAFGGIHASNIARSVHGHWVDQEPLWERLDVEIRHEMQNAKRKI